MHCYECRGNSKSKGKCFKILSIANCLHAFADYEKCECLFLRELLPDNKEYLNDKIEVFEVKFVCKSTSQHSWTKCDKELSLKNCVHRFGLYEPCPALDIIDFSADNRERKHILDLVKK